MKRVAVLVVLGFFAMVGSASASTNTARCLAHSGAKATISGHEIAADWKSNSVSVWHLQDHSTAVAFAKAGLAAGKPASANVVVGSTLATFWKSPTRSDLARVKPCL